MCFKNVSRNDELNHRPKSVVVLENIEAGRKPIMCEIEASMGISMTNIPKIIHKHLSVKKNWARLSKIQ